MPLPPTIGGKVIVFSGHPSFHSWSVVYPVLHDTISTHLVERYQWNLPQIFSMSVAVAEKVFSVRSERSGSCMWMLQCRIHTVWWCGIEAVLFSDFFHWLWL